MTDSNVSVDQLAGVYVKIREAKSKLKADFDEKYGRMTEQQDKIKRALLDYCKEQGLNSFNTNHGTVSRRTKTRYWTNDWPSMYKFIEEQHQPEFFEKRLNQTVVKTFMEEHPDITPPGLNVDAEYIVSVTKPKKPRTKVS
jgi:hypothetical protein